MMLGWASTSARGNQPAQLPYGSQWQRLSHASRPEQPIHVQLATCIPLLDFIPAQWSLLTCSHHAAALSSAQLTSYPLALPYMVSKTANKHDYNY